MSQRDETYWLLSLVIYNLQSLKVQTDSFMTILSHNIFFFPPVSGNKNCPGPCLSLTAHFATTMNHQVEKTFCCLSEEQTHQRYLICSLYKGQRFTHQTVHCVAYVYHGVTAPDPGHFFC